MELKLSSAEIAGNHIQLTYTDDGQAATQTESLLTVRAPLDGSHNLSLNRHCLNVLERLHGWIEQEYKRVSAEIEGRK